MSMEEPSSGSASQPVNSSGGSPKATSFGRQLAQCGLMLALALLSYLCISHFVVQSVQVVGASMTPTLRDADRCVVNRLVYHFRAPQRSDVVVLRDPSGQCYAVKRIVGTEGDAISLTNGCVYVNGKKLDESYLPRATSTFPSWQDNFICGKDQYFVF